MSFEAFELGCDKDVPERAPKMLAEHRSCADVAVWGGDRPLMERHRSAAVGKGFDRPTGVSPKVCLPMWPATTKSPGPPGRGFVALMKPELGGRGEASAAKHGSGATEPHDHQGPGRRLRH